MNFFHQGGRLWLAHFFIMLKKLLRRVVFPWLLHARSAAAAAAASQRKRAVYAVIDEGAAADAAQFCEFQSGGRLLILPSCVLLSFASPALETHTHLQH